MRAPARYIANAAVCTLALVVVSVAAVRAASQQASITIALTVASHVSLTDDCTDDPGGYELGTVLPGSTALTSTGSDVCSFDFTSTNNTAMLRMFQADQGGEAMGEMINLGAVNGGPAAMDLAMTGALTAWRVDNYGRIDYTSNGGASWVNQADYSDTTGIAAFTGSTAVAVGAGPIVTRTTNTGGTWTPVVVPGLTQDVNAIVAASATVGWLVTNGGGIWKTTDAGATWASQTSNFGGQAVRDVDAISATTAVAVGGSGKISYTTTGGTTWVSADYSTGGYRHVAMESASRWMVHDRVANFVYTSNSGSSYTQRRPGDNAWANLYTLINTGADTYVGTGTDGSIIRTTNAGTSWSTQDSHEVGVIRVADELGGNMIALGAAGHLSLASADAGVTWTVTGGSYSYADITASGTSRMVRVGANGLIQRSSNAGQSWTSSTSGTTERLWSVAASGDIFLAVGDNGTILRSTDAGETWTPSTSGTTDDLLAVDFGDASTVWTSGENGELLKSTNSGSTWTPAASPTGNRLKSLAAGSALTAHTADNSGDVYTTSNGTAWAKSYDGGVYGPIDDITAFDDQTAMFGDGWNDLFYTTNGGSSWTQRSGWNSGMNFVEYGDGGTVMGVGVNLISFANSHTGPIKTSSSGHQYPTGCTAIGQQLYCVGVADRLIVGREDDGIADYAFNSTDWNQGADMFGVCLQRLTGANTVADWTEDGSGTANECEANDGDPWNAVDTAPDKIAHTTATGATGTVDLVFGARVNASQSPAEMYANIIVEAVAPNI